MTLDDLKEVDVDNTTSRYLIFFAFKPTTARVQKINIYTPSVFRQPCEYVAGHAVTVFLGGFLRRAIRFIQIRTACVPFKQEDTLSVY